MSRLLFTVLAFLLLVACRGTDKKTASSQPNRKPHFRTVSLLPQATPEQQRTYMTEHYWDRFDFCDTTFIAKVDTAEMLNAYFSYIVNYVGPLNQEPIRHLMKQASTSKKMFEYFVMLAENVLHDPNSIARSDELYIPVLEAQIASPYYDKYERMAPEYDLEMACKNRIGNIATDFVYTTASGKQARMSSIKSEFLILYINNPGCHMCKEVREALSSSEIIQQLIANGELRILSIYPDANLVAWRQDLDNAPKEWINAYDKDCIIETQGLYDLRAIPSLYLLAADKTVLVKDTTSVNEIEYTILNMYF